MQTNKEVKDLLISKKADPEKTDLFFKFLLLLQKKESNPYKETVKDLVESIEQRSGMLCKRYK